jgi:IS5 family transposase
MAMNQAGLFDWQTRLEQLDDGGDPLVKLNQVVPWELFRKDMEKMRTRNRLSNAGRKPFDVILMFKMLVLQSLYNLSDDQIEFQVRDRLSFMRFLGLSLKDTVPDAKTVWLFREQMIQARLIKKVFDRFDRFLRKQGFAAKKGQIIDASIVQAPRQRNSKSENQQIKSGQIPDNWSENKKRQKDTEARWFRKAGSDHYGYKNHIAIDVKHKLIRGYEVTSASVHDSNVFEELLDESNSSRDVWADSAYVGHERSTILQSHGFRDRRHRKGCRQHKLTEREKQGNRTRSKIRCRIEHVFGVQAQRAGNLLIRTIGLVRARAKIGLRNIAYNIDRFSLLATP